MILYDPEQTIHFKDYGIQIPVHESKAKKAVNALLNNPLYKEKISRYLIKTVEASIHKEDLLRVHSAEYVEKLYSEQIEEVMTSVYELIDQQGKYHRYNPGKALLPLSHLLSRSLGFASGTYQCCKIALEKKFCFYFGGGMHHAHRDYGSGFCVINDSVIALKKLQAEQLIENAWIIDLDAHKGDGTAELVEGDNSIRALSIHMARGWPLDSPEFDESGTFNRAYARSTIDIPIEKGEEPVYLEKLQNGLEQLETGKKPDIALVLSGADPYIEDELTSTNLIRLTAPQLKERDIAVYEFLEKRNISRAYLTAGGYGKHSWKVYHQFLEYWLGRVQ